MIPLNEPRIAKNALKYVTDCVRTGWISSAGAYIEKFEINFAKYLEVKHAITTTSGTTALHLALASLGIGEGDEVIIPALTMMAVPFAVLYTGASCVSIDVDSEIFNISPEKIKSFIEKNCSYNPNTKQLINKHTNKRLKAIIPVHTYGHPCDMAGILQVAKKYSLLVIEDAAEAHGAEYHKDILGKKSNKDTISRKAGSMGDIGCFSFFANKIITTGEGGMVVTNSDEIAEKARALKDLCHCPERRFLHTGVGFNYRMTNLQAALGLAQLEEIQDDIKIKREMAQMYNELLKDIPGITTPIEKPWAKSVYWMYAILVEPDFGISRDTFMKRLKEQGVDTRPFFIPIDKQPFFNKKICFRDGDCSVSNSLSEKGLYLPSALTITEEQIHKVCSSIRKVSQNF